MAWGKQRQFGIYIPDIGAGGRGLLLPIPGGLTTPNSLWKTTFTTDGDAISGSDTVAAGVARIVAAMDEGASSPPVRVKGDVFYQCSRQGPAVYHLILVDPGYVDPVERQVVVTNQLPGNWKLSDRLTGAMIQTLASGESATVTVPAGCLHVLELGKGE